MKNQDVYRILPIELSITLIGMILGVGILTLPKVLAQQVGTPDGWISIILSGLIAMVIIVLYTRLNRSFPEKNLLQILEYGRAGKWVAKLFGLCFSVYFFSVIVFEARILATVVKIYLLVDTPSEIVVAVTFLTVAYAVSKGIQGVIHLNLLFVPICTFVLLGIVLLNATNFQLGELLPIMPKGVMPVVLGVKEALVSFLGLEILFFLMAYMKVANMKATPLNISIGFITFLYLIVTLLCFSVFSVEATKFIVFPTVELAKEVEIAGGIFERLESLLITVWLISIFNTMSLSLLLINTTIHRLFLRKAKPIWILSSVTAIAYFSSFFPHSITQAFTFGKWVSFFGISLIFLGLTAGYFVLWRTKRSSKRQRGAQDANQ